MKNFVIATVSAVALLGTAAYAVEGPAHQMPQGAAPAHQMGEHHAMKAEHCPSHHRKKHHHKKHHKVHHKHRHVEHCGHGGPLHVRVNFPPYDVSAFSACPCEYYQGNQACQYVYHDGYYWYPQTRADLWAGFRPINVRGSHWYPSILHPHAVYAEKQSPLHPILIPVEGEVGMGSGPNSLTHCERHGHHRHHGRHHARHHRHHHARHHAVRHHAPMHHEGAAHSAHEGM